MNIHCSSARAKCLLTSTGQREGAPSPEGAPHVLLLGRRQDGGRLVAFEPLEQSALALVQPPVVLDDPEDAHEGQALLTCQEEEQPGLRMLCLHAASVRRRAASVGGETVNARGTSG